MMLQDSCSSLLYVRRKNVAVHPVDVISVFLAQYQHMSTAAGFRLWWMLIDVDLCATRDSTYHLVI